MDAGFYGYLIVRDGYPIIVNTDAARIVANSNVETSKYPNIDE